MSLYETDAAPRAVHRPALALAGLILLAGCAAPQAAAPVVASFYPIQYLAETIVGGAMEVAVLVPPGVEPHDYEPTPGDAAKVSDARLLLVQGAGFEGWIGTVRAQAPDARFVAVTDGLSLRDNPDPEEAAELPQDPHTWLDPTLFAASARNVQAALNATFPDEAAGFAPRADALVARLHALDAEFQQGLADCEVRVVVSNHAAFGYMAARYDFELIAISGLDPEAEPGPATIQEVVEKVREHGVRVVYFEELASPAVAQAVAREAGATTRVLSPIEGIPEDELREGASYETRMRDDLAALREGMRCA